MTRDQVAAAENANADSETEFAGQHQMVFHSFVDGHSAAITYLLENNQLRAASYRIRNDENRQVYAFMRDFLTRTYGAPTVQKDQLVGWRPARSEIALTWLPDKTCYVAFWDKEYFARMNNLGTSGDTTSF